MAYGCQQKHGKHKEKHNGLVKFLQDIGEPQIAKHWLDLENVRIGGVYGHQHGDSDVREAQRLWQEIRIWALS
jgi:hypothetical protein